MWFIPIFCRRKQFILNWREMTKKKKVLNTKSMLLHEHPSLSEQSDIQFYLLICPVHSKCVIWYVYSKFCQVLLYFVTPHHFKIPWNIPQWHLAWVDQRRMRNHWELVKAGIFFFVYIILLVCLGIQWSAKLRSWLRYKSELLYCIIFNIKTTKHIQKATNWKSW